MNLKKYFLLSAIMGLATFTSCSDDGISEPLKLNFSVRNLGNTSTSVDTKGVGLWISSTSVTNLKDADVARNQKFIPNGQELTAEGINWTGQEKLYTYGYYPYDANASGNPEAYAVNATDNPNLMWAKTETSFNGQNNNPKLSFTHLMSKIVLNVKSDAKEAGALVGGEVTLKNFKTKGTANLLTGKIDANAETSDIIPTSVTTASGYEGTYEVIVVPQAIEANAEFLIFETTGGLTIKGAINNVLNLNAGEETTLEIVLKEEECVVKVQEIKAWEELDAESAIAEKYLPTVNLFDLYDYDGVKGIVISLDEGSEGKHGWLISLDGTTCKYWEGDGAPIIWPQDKNDATKNLEAVLEIDPELNAFPAMKWCNEKNVNGVEGWVLPAHNVLKIFGSLVLANSTNLSILNEALADAGGDKIDLSTEDIFANIYFFSSTCSMTRNVYCIAYSPYYAAYYPNYPDYVYMPSETYGQMNEANVRAFYHF